MLVTDRDRIVAEPGPPRASRSPLLADARLSEAVRRGWITPPALRRGEAPPRQPVTTLACRPTAFGTKELTSSRLLEYEVWTRIHARRLAGSL